MPAHEDGPLLPSRLTEMRAWASEQRPGVRERVWRLCDALESCAEAASAAQAATDDAQRLVGELQADARRLRALIGKEPF